jgi:hypothetical protein
MRVDRCVSLPGLLTIGAAFAVASCSATVPPEAPTPTPTLAAVDAAARTGAYLHDIEQQVLAPQGASLGTGAVGYAQQPDIDSLAHECVPGEDRFGEYRVVFGAEGSLAVIDRLQASIRHWLGANGFSTVAENVDRVVARNEAGYWIAVSHTVGSCCPTISMASPCVYPPKR